MYSKYSGLGGGGGSGSVEIGNAVVGGDPNSVLFIDGAGDLAQSASFTFDGSTLLAPPGTYDPVTGVPGVAIGAANTGFVYDDAMDPSLNIHVNGRYMQTWWLPDATTGTCIFNVGEVRRDAAVNSILGSSGAPWTQVYGSLLASGSQSTAGTGRGVRIRQNTTDTDPAVFMGIGWDFSNGTTNYFNEVFFKGYDSVAASYLDFINFSQQDRITTISSPLNSNTTNPAPSNPNGQTMILKGGDTNVASADGGNVVLTPGEEGAGGVPGCVYLPNTSGAPGFTPQAVAGHSALFADPTNDKLWLYNGTGWVSVDLT